MFKFASVIVLLSLSVVVLMTGCSTIEGVGKDLQDISKITKEYIAKEEREPNEPKE